mmetsp:Transcript_42205/g.78517  ORF Transcript_42205/g.78517 Transcript_42205/m.78517 type:complete len:464 (+) Transcript_42205:100-1491(+)
MKPDVQADYGSASSSSRKEEQGELATNKGNSAILTAGLLIADVVGAGVLALGSAVAQLGWLYGTVSILLMMAMNAHIMIMVWKVHCRFPGAHSFKELVSQTFAHALPERLELAQELVVMGQYTYLFSLLAVYTLSIGQGLGMFFYDMHTCLPIMTLVGCCMLLPLNYSARFLGSFAGSVGFNFACTAGTVLIPIVWMAAQGAEVTRPEGSEFLAVASKVGFDSFVTSASTFAFAFSGQFILVEIMSEMQDMREFPKAYFSYSLPFQAAAFLGVGLSVYYYRGDSASDMIVNEIPFGNAERYAAICLVGHMLITYVIKNVVLCRGLLKELQKRAVIESGASWSAWYCMVSAVVASSWFLAQIVPFFDDLVNLLGATFTPVVAFMVPITLYLLCVQKQDFSVSRTEKFIIGLEITVSVVMLCYGAVSTMIKILHKWDSYGYPFECHCQNLWRTCQCSPHRMECPA